MRQTDVPLKSSQEERTGLFVCLTGQEGHNKLMSLSSFTTFSKSNRRMIRLLVASHLLWSCAIFGLWSFGSMLEASQPWWSVLFIVLQLYAAAQLLLPALLLHPEERTRGFYLFWGVILGLSLWLINQLNPHGLWLPLLTGIKSGLLLLTATVTGAALAGYIHRLWEIIPVCIVMTLADFASWLFGPTARFVQEIRQFQLDPTGPPPLIDMILVKLALPGAAGLAPVFGISDWVMVVFFAIVARRHRINDNLTGPSGETLAQQGKIGRYLPISVAALMVAIVLAQLTGLFIPALPLIAVIMLGWYVTRRRLPGAAPEGGN